MGAVQRAPIRATPSGDAEMRSVRNEVWAVIHEAAERVPKSLGAHLHHSVLRMPEMEPQYLMFALLLFHCALALFILSVSLSPLVWNGNLYPVPASPFYHGICNCSFIVQGFTAKSLS